MNKKFLNILLILIVSLSVLSGCSAGENNFFNDLDITAQSASDYVNYDLSNIPDYDGKAYVELNGNVPEFSESEKTYSESFEEYGKLDSLGR